MKFLTNMMRACNNALMLPVPWIWIWTTEKKVFIFSAFLLGVECLNTYMATRGKGDVSRPHFFWNEKKTQIKNEFLSKLTPPPPNTHIYTRTLLDQCKKIKIWGNNPRPLLVIRVSKICRVRKCPFMK